MITDGLANAFKSERLIFRALENNDEDKKFLHTQIENDPINLALSDPRVVKPNNAKYCEGMVEELLKAVLTVMICLPPDETADENTTGGGSEDAKTDDSPPPKAPPPSAPTPIGFVCLGWGAGEPTQHRSISLGITLAAAHQGKGYGAEAVNWALDWAFRLGGYHRVALSSISHNERALRLYRKLGFVEEGRGREAHYHDRRWYDMVNFGMLEHEWEALRGLKAE